MILTLKELANYLRVNERTILRMQKSGQIQGIKIGGQWRFNGSQIDSLFFPHTPLEVSSETVPLKDFMPKDVSVPVSRLLREDRFCMNLQADTGKDAIDEMVSVIVSKSLCLNASDLRKAIHGREALLSTGVGDGVAIPHPRDPVPNLREPAVMIVGRSENGIEFGASDGQPVHLFFLICCQTIQSHLNVLGKLASLCSDKAVLENLKTVGTPEDFIREVLRSERENFIG